MRALDTVEDHVREQRGLSQRESPLSSGLPQPYPRRWAARVRDVMTTTVVTVEESIPYKEIARLLAENKISGVPVLSTGRHVAGVVSEADLLAEEEKRAWERVAVPGHGLRSQGHWALTARQLMSSPAITIHPDATTSGAARLMNAHHVRRLPVVDSGGCLLGIVSRRDLLSVLLRPDSDVAAEVRVILDEMLRADQGVVTVTVKDGVVALAGPLGADRDLVAVAIRLAWGVDGVIDVVDCRSASDAATKSAADDTASATSESF
jgi:CBS domain-containing protein